MTSTHDNGGQALRRMAGLKNLAGLIACLGMLFMAGHAAGDEVSMPEYQVKALFLLNFIKYVDWPPGSFSGDNTPVIIAVYGEDRFGDSLKRAVQGKTIAGRRIIIQFFGKNDAMVKCNILFISDSERAYLGEMLNKIKGLPVLTVGESDLFLEKGGMINCVKKEGKIRLEINLDSARQAKLQISSKLLSVADVVKGKPN
jgi:YfiR/HmsC-like